MVVCRYELKEATQDDAGKAMRTASGKRGDQHSAGYMSVAELVEWVVRDLTAAIDHEFPKEEVP